jgi:hypothetical protein
MGGVRWPIKPIGIIGEFVKHPILRGVWLGIGDVVEIYMDLDAGP